MTRSKPNSSLISALVIAAAFAITSVSGCIFDPWPEPGEATGDDGSNDGTDTGSDLGDSDTESDGGWQIVDGNLIYCSAPSPDGDVSVVGISGAIGGGTTVTVTGSNGQQEEFAKYDNGSFAGRIEAEAGEALFVTVTLENYSSDPVEVTAGTLEGNPIEDDIIDPADVPAPNADGLVYIHGENDDSFSDVIVVGGNIDLSAGSSAEMDCSWGDCIFDLYIPASTGDEVDLFLVHVGESSGYSDSQTIVIPAT